MAFLVDFCLFLLMLVMCSRVSCRSPVGKVYFVYFPGLRNGVHTRMVVSEDGQEAFTQYWPVERFGDASKRCQLGESKPVPQDLHDTYYIYNILLYIQKGPSWGLRLALLYKETFYCIYAYQLCLAKHKDSNRAKPNITVSVMSGIY